jgi:hypothetical protein
MNDILLPLARRHGTNLITGVGEMSLTSVHQFLDRVRAAGKPARIIYVSDHDPAGRSMPVAVARKIEFALTSSGTVDIKLDPVVLTADQVRRYSLPRVPIKDTERRASKFEARFGEGAVELDALEALHPGELERIVRREIERYIDPDGKRAFDVAAWEYDARLRRLSETVHAQHQAEIDELRDRYQGIIDRFADFQSRAKGLFGLMHAELLDCRSKIEPFQPPAPREPDDPPNPLFDSSRDYLSQIDRYRAWQEGAEDTGDA